LTASTPRVFCVHHAGATSAPPLKGKVQFVVVFNLTRFAREKYDHFALRAHLKSLGISLRSATEPIDDTSTGKLMEGVLAAFAQFDNDVRSERTAAG
jgi:DNA invertase Pin-like site-specific DNA recombinase